MFKSPKIELEEKRVWEIPFHGTVAAGGFLTLVSGSISFPFRVIQVKMIFDPAANNLVEHRWFVSKNQNAPTTAFPTDGNIFSRLSPNAGFIGDAIIRVVPTNIGFRDPPYFIKLGTQNGLGAAYIANAAINIEEI